MCGISGIVIKNGGAVDPNQIKAMNDKIVHRGPDGHGTFFYNNLGLGHRRLSIIDLSDHASQPMTYDQDLVITFNGEIYNYIEIKAELTEKGYVFASQSDTEVILAAYKEWGSDCVSRFNGMWSFAILDKKTDKLFCSRDRFGIKPFYFLNLDNQFIFGSEIKQLLHFIDSPKVNERILLDYLITGLEECDDQTFFQDVEKLLGGHNLTFDLKTGQYSIKKFYEITVDESKAKLQESEAIEIYEKNFLNAVRLRMRSDVKVGTCLSGGLDSSTVAAFSSKIYQEDSEGKFIGIHAKSSEKDSDESELAAIVAEHCNLDLQLIEPSAEEFKSLVNEVIETQEEPFGGPSIFMQYLVMKKAREINCTVLLDGQGGDETLLGYEKYFPSYILSKKGISKVRSFWNSSSNSKLSRLDVLKYYYYFKSYSTRIKRLKKRFSYIKPEVLSSFQSEALSKLSGKYHDILKLQKIEISSTQLPHLLRYEDKNSMRNSIETRLPFIDYQVLESAVSINNDLKIKDGWTKYILRKIGEDKLPEKIVWRKNKLGFNAPEKTWLSNIEPDMIVAIKSSKILEKYIDFERFDFNAQDLRTKWRLFNIAKWEEIFKVQIP